ncbi:MAG: hypothetical protein EZS28_009208 [Streblomastix strix]|uniref:Reverse transcriptase domain-containing protein n=1 Tax=Streblomastix strix TaxID=222440 RepID=A0A5J4WKB8_9EUKA|nr:MAG: hypothetical protein EZS28_009208 [Streblomastix strix]
MLHELMILSNQYELEGNTKEIQIDLVGMCAALLCFAKKSTYIRIQMKEGAQGAYQFDFGYNGVMSHAIHPLHELRLIQVQGSQDLVNPQAGQYYATAMGPGQQIPQLVTEEDTNLQLKRYEWIWLKMTTINITMIMIMTTTAIIDTSKRDTTRIINQTWEEVEKEGEQFLAKVQGMGRIMRIGLMVYIMRLRDKNQDNLEFFTKDENRPYLWIKQQHEHQSIQDPKRQIEIKEYKGEQVQYINRTEQNENGTGEQYDEFQEDFVNEPQNMEIRPQDKKIRNITIRKLQRNEQSGTAREGSLPVIHKTETEITHQQKAIDSPSNINKPTEKTTSDPNENQSSILNADLMGMITNPFSIQKGIQHQYIAADAAQVYHAPRETFSTNGNVRKVASSTDSIVSGQVWIAGTKPINIQTAPSTQFQVNLIRELKVKKKGGRTPVRVKTRNADSQVRAPGRFQLNGIQNRTKEEIQILEIFPRTLMEETLQPQPNTGMGGGTICFHEDSEKRQQVRLRIYPFSGSKEEEIAQTEKFEEELRENIIEEINPEQAKWFNITFIIPKPNQKWKKILDASSLNNEIQMIHFKMNETDQIRDQIRKRDWATSLDLKSAFHHRIVYPLYRPYLAFEAMEKVNQYRAKLFGTQHSPIFFVQAQAVVLMKIRKVFEIRILKNVDDLLLLHQNKERLRKQTQIIIMRILEAIEWTIAKEKCEIEPQQQINLLRRTLDLEKMYIKMTDLRKQELRFQLRKLISLLDRQVPIKIKYLESIIGKLIFLRFQVKEASLYLKLMDLAKNENAEEQGMEREYDSTQINTSRALLVAGNDSEELRDDIRGEDSSGSDGIRRISKGMGSDSVTSNRGCFNPTWRMEYETEELQIKAIVIKSDSSTAVQDLAKQRAGYTLVAEVKKIVKLFQHLKIQTQTRHIPRISKNITCALSRLSIQGDYQVNKEIFIALCQAWEITPTLDLFATGENKLVDRFVAIREEEEETEWLNAFSGPWKEEIFLIHQPIPKIGKALIAWEKFIPKSIMIAPWWPGQIWFTHVLIGCSRYLILGESSLSLKPEKEMTIRKNMLLSGKIAAFFMDLKEIQQMIIEGLKYYIQKKYKQTIGLFDDWKKEKNYTIENIINQNIPFIHTEFMTQLIKERKTKPPLAKHHASILNAMFSLTFGTVQVTTTVQRLTTYAISNHTINNQRYGSTQDINQLMEEMANIDLSLSIIVDEEHTAAVCIPPKQSKKSERYDVRKTEDLRVCPKETFVRYFSTRLEGLVQTLGVQNATTNSIKHASSTELTAQGSDVRTINVFTHHTPDSKMNKEFYIFVVNREQESLASALVKNDGEKQATQIISKQTGDARLFPQDTLASRLYFPIISTQPIVEAESMNDLVSAKVQNSQMQKDDQDVQPQDEAQKSSMRKDSDLATTVGAQK